jgi:hypothetical protein
MSGSRRFQPAARADIVEKAVKYFGDGCSREFDGTELILIAPQLCARRPNLSF